MVNANLEDKIDKMLIDLAVVKTDITWLKRTMVSVFVLISAIFGIDVSGMMV